VVKASSLNLKYGGGFLWFLREEFSTRDGKGGRMVSGREAFLGGLGGDLFGFFSFFLCALLVDMLFLFFASSWRFLACGKMAPPFFFVYLNLYLLPCINFFFFAEYALVAIQDLSCLGVVFAKKHGVETTRKMFCFSAESFFCLCPNLQVHETGRFANYHVVN
jgi:hypothetical protein